MRVSGRLIRIGAGAALVAAALAPTIGGGATASTSSSYSSRPWMLQCNKNTSADCMETWDSEKTFGEGTYVGHDEPSLLYYSNTPGAGNQMQWKVQLPVEPSTANYQQKTYTFMLTPAFWFGMAMCDTQSAPNPVDNHTCTPDSDSNITTDANISRHAGTAYMEMQFYPPGWATWPAGISCDATHWCAALNIDSLSEDYPHGETNNATCANQIGLEYVNFAWITKNGEPQAPVNPVQANAATYTPDPNKDLFMNQGDTIAVTMHDTSHGLRIDLQDNTTGQTGFMVASAANSFGQVKFDPNGNGCTNIPYDFHPMYSTSSTQTRVPWAAHSYNIAYDPETGHFDYCNGGVDSSGNCTGTEGNGDSHDADDTACFSASQSTLVPVSGCIASNYGFDGTSYLPDWPDGNYKHPQPILVYSPKISPTSNTGGRSYGTAYQQVAFEADLPRIEAVTGQCDRTTGKGCTYYPETDDGYPASFYPFFSDYQASSNVCLWFAGNYYPGKTTSDWGGVNQYGSLLNLVYPATGSSSSPNYGTTSRYNDFRQILSNDPC